MVSGARSAPDFFAPNPYKTCRLWSKIGHFGDLGALSALSAEYVASRFPTTLMQIPRGGG